MNRERWLRTAGPLVVLVLVLGLWQGYVVLFHVEQIIMPTPVQVADSLVRGFRSGLFQRHILYTAREVAFGFVFGVILGILLGAPIALSRSIELIFYPYILALQAMPKVALAPLVMIWVGIGIESKILITTIVAMFPIMVNVIIGLRAVEPARINLIRAMNGSMWAEFRYVRLPSAAPFIFAGLKTAAVLSLLGALTAEFVGSEAGLGYLMSQLMFKVDTPGVFAVLVILSVIGVALFMAADWLHQRVVFWDRPQRLTGR